MSFRLISSMARESKSLQRPIRRSPGIRRVVNSSFLPWPNLGHNANYFLGFDCDFMKSCIAFCPAASAAFVSGDISTWLVAESLPAPQPQIPRRVATINEVDMIETTRIGEGTPLMTKTDLSSAGTDAQREETPDRWRRTLDLEDRSPNHFRVASIPSISRPGGQGEATIDGFGVPVEEPVTTPLRAMRGIRRHQLT